MATTILKISLVAMVVILVCAFILSQRQQATGLRKEVNALRAQLEGLTKLGEENQRLNEQLKSANQAAQANSTELLRVRAQLARLRQEGQESRRSKAGRDNPAKQAPDAQSEADIYDQIHGPGSHARMYNGLHWGYALIRYANEHQDLFPPTLEEAASFLPDFLTAEEKALAVVAADQWEILYRGRYADMTNPPPEGAILLREKQPWRTANGEWSRGYIFGDGIGKIHTESDGNFDKWEGPRIPKSNGQ